MSANNIFVLFLRDKSYLNLAGNCLLVCVSVRRYIQRDLKGLFRRNLC